MAMMQMQGEWPTLAESRGSGKIQPALQRAGNSNMSRQSTRSPSISSCCPMAHTISNASTAVETVFSRIGSIGSTESVSSSTPPSTPRMIPSCGTDSSLMSWTASSTLTTASSSDDNYATETTFSVSPPSSLFDTAASAVTSLRVLDAPFPTNLVVRNTFLDFANDSLLGPSLKRRARSAPCRPSSQLEGSDGDSPAETSISNVGVGSDDSSGVPYPVGKLDAKQHVQGDAGRVADLPTILTQPALFVNLPSVGSAAHFHGQCVPCGFFWKTRGCENGAKCEYCHLCDAREKKRRQKAKKAFFKAQAQPSQA